MKDTMIGIDLAKNIIVLHGTSMTGDLQFRKRLSRGQFVNSCSVIQPPLSFWKLVAALTIGHENCRPVATR